MIDPILLDTSLAGRLFIDIEARLYFDTYGGFITEPFGEKVKYSFIEKDSGELVVVADCYPTFITKNSVVSDTKISIPKEYEKDLIPFKVEG